jgi:hypothetical protein
MNSLVFLVLMGLKNTFLETLRKPAKLALYIFVILLLAGLVVLSAFTRQAVENPLDLIWLKGILFLLILVLLILGIQTGLSNGAQIFDMSDVNLLFVSPVDAGHILLYGIVRMAKISLLAGFFILFQGNSLAAGFGIGFGAVLLILLGFILANSLTQIVSLLIYSLSNGRPGRKRIVTLISIAAFLPMTIYGGIQFFLTGDLWQAAENLLRSPIVSWTPVAGWASEGALAFIAGNPGTGFLFFGVIAIAAALIIVYIMFSNPDYYEDVLVAAETASDLKRSIAEGQINPVSASSRKIRVSKTGVGGLGAGAVFYKHLRESFRANRLGLWGIPSIVLVIAVIILSLAMKDLGIIMPLGTFMGGQIFLIGTGRGLRELYSPYIYLIPEGSFSKIIWSNLELLCKILGETLVMFIAAGIILAEPPVLVAACILVFILFSLLLIGVNYLSLRFTGADMSAGILVLVYMLTVILIMLPGLVPAMIVGFSIEGEGLGLLAGLGILAAWELIASIICFALSQGILHHCDMPAVKAPK